MIRLLCPAARCYLTASYTSSPLTSVLLTLLPRSLFLFSQPSISSLFGERVSKEELLWSTRRRPTVFLRLCSPQVWINCCVFDIHSLSGPGRRRRDERIKGKVTQRAISVCLPALLSLPPLHPSLFEFMKYYFAIISYGNRYLYNIWFLSRRLSI